MESLVMELLSGSPTRRHETTNKEKGQSQSNHIGRQESEENNAPLPANLFRRAKKVGSPAGNAVLA
jgi:hypothetical protein